MASYCGLKPNSQTRIPNTIMSTNRENSERELVSDSVPTATVITNIGKPSVKAPGALKAIALDAFGTLCYIGKKKNPYARLLRASGMLGASAVRTAMSRPLGLQELADALTPEAKKIEIAGLMPSLQSDLSVEIGSIAVFPEALDALSELRDRGLKLVVVSNLAQPYGAAVRQLFSGLVDYIAFSFELNAVKPEPEIFAAVCRALALEADEVMMIGDSRSSDYAGARAFGMQALHLDRSGKTQSAEVISDLRGIRPHLEG